MKELNRQYDEALKVFSNINSKKFSDWIDQKKEGWFQKNFYGGYGGYEYYTNFDRRSAYYKQGDDPSLADYERMKRDFSYLKHDVDYLRRENDNKYVNINNLNKK